MTNTLNERSPWVRTWREISGNYLALASFAVLCITAAIALLAPWIAPHSPESIQLVEGRLLPPFFMDGGMLTHLLGTDATGRDVLSRLMWGGRVSLVVANQRYFARVSFHSFSAHHRWLFRPGHPQLDDCGGTVQCAGLCAHRSQCRPVRAQP
jgi:ABC-type dipeptide/oligopeptide/nickel transport system permease subunit